MATATLEGYCGFPQLGRALRFFEDLSLKTFDMASFMEKYPEALTLFEEGQVLFLGSPTAVGEGLCDRRLVLRFLCADNEVIKRMWENNRKAISGNGGSVQG